VSANTAAAILMDIFLLATAVALFMDQLGASGRRTFFVGVLTFFGLLLVLIGTLTRPI